MNAHLRRRGLLAAVMFVLMLVPIACNAPGGGGYGGGGNAASGAPAAAPAGAPNDASPAKGKYGY